jgi:GNAT superfamily N-acetyltransferase
MTAAAMHVRRITVEETWPLRLQALRPGGKLAERHFENDGQEKQFHLGVEIGPKLICIGSFHPERHGSFDHTRQYRLRGMATDPQHQGRGAGSLLIDAAIKELRSMQVELLWCNARRGARVFYERAGLQIHGDEFDVPGIGPHFLMYRIL